ncbi:MULTISPECIES: hypothetical protein [unclassified Psychrobacter]|uniref:hypothetical protein n=1 Tax=unclassified Psychrobacter TaxID=196806 RepID=UPI0025FF3273|nr:MULTISPECIES: hypothetical protein [unclassified Psychrobacter]
MKNSVLKKTFQNKLWIAVLASLIGLSACSNEREDTTNASTDSATADSSEMNTVNDNVQSTDAEADEMAPVATPQDNTDAMNTSTDTSTDNTGNDEDHTYYSGVDSVEDEEKGVDAVTVNENNPNLNQTPAEGVQ